MTTFKPTHCFFVPGKPGIIDTLTPDKLGMFSRETLEQVRVRYPGADIGELDHVTSLQNSFWIQAPVEISEERFQEMLCVLPPEDWHRSKESESFKMCERTSGMITAIYARIDEKYYYMEDKCNLTHAEILGKIKMATL